MITPTVETAFGDIGVGERGQVRQALVLLLGLEDLVSRVDDKERPRACAAMIATEAFELLLVS